MKKHAVLILLIILILFLATISCIGGGGGDNSGSLKGKATMAANATATYGAEQFHLQLTAISEQGQ